MKIAILGHGQVGQALEKVYLNSAFGQPLIKDLDRNDYEDLEKLDILNICIPYGKDFEKIVLNEIEKYNVELTIIHSTVLPYTTKHINSNTKFKVVHSPIRGKHDNLFKGLTSFVKYIGTENKAAGKMTREHFVTLGIVKNKIYKPSVITEINKLISTTYYAHCIVFTDYVDNLLEKYKVDFETFKHFNDSYNRGYRRFRMKHVNRPTLTAPENNKITGECLVPNAKLLEEIYPDNVTKSILEYE